MGMLLEKPCLPMIMKVKLRIDMVLKWKELITLSKK